LVFKPPSCRWRLVLARNSSSGGFKPEGVNLLEVLNLLRVVRAWAECLLQNIDLSPVLLFYYSSFIFFFTVDTNVQTGLEKAFVEKFENM